MELHSFLDFVLKLIHVSSVVNWEDEFSDSLSFCPHCFLLNTTNGAYFTWKSDLPSHTDLLLHWFVQGQRYQSRSNCNTGWWAIFTDLDFWEVQMNIVFLKEVIREEYRANVFGVGESQLATFFHYIMDIASHNQWTLCIFLFLLFIFLVFFLFNHNIFD